MSTSQSEYLPLIVVNSTGLFLHSTRIKDQTDIRYFFEKFGFHSQPYKLELHGLDSGQSTDYDVVPVRADSAPAKIMIRIEVYLVDQVLRKRDSFSRSSRIGKQKKVE
jgi:hypothetical protein